MGFGGRNAKGPKTFNDVVGARAAEAALGPEVEATKKGFYNGRRLRVGARFRLVDAKHFTPDWMKRVDAGEAGKPQRGELLLTGEPSKRGKAAPAADDSENNPIGA